MAPVLSTSFGMLVNTDLFKKEKMEVPTTWGEFLEVCDTFKKAGYTSPVMGYISDEPGSLEYNFAYPSLCREAVTDPSMRDRFNDLDAGSGELMRPGLEKLKALADAGYIDVEKCTKEIENNYDAAIMRFFEGDVPMLICPGDVVSGTKKRESKSEAFEENPFAYDFYVAPSGDEGGYYMDSISLLFCVNKNSENLDMTNESMRFLASEEELGLMAQEKRLITPTKDYSLDEVYASLSDFPEERTINFRDTELLDTTVKQFRAAAYAVVNGEMTVDEAVASYGTIPTD
jgi:multiple sugar transport system substrate-binding protein